MIKGANGDREECAYEKGVKQGPAVYHWKAGHQSVHSPADFSRGFASISLSCSEKFRFERGSANGPALLTGVSGATRKGTRRNGLWHGKAVFTSSDGEAKEENWENGRKI